MIQALAAFRKHYPEHRREEIDKCIRAFFWACKEKVNGGQCLVAWDQVCRAKSEGGLVVRSLAAQNECLLLKMVHRPHVAQRSRWAAWVWAEANGRSLLGNGGRALGEQGVALARLIPLYRALSSVDVKDGRTVSFWIDRWLPCGPIAAAFPALFSHSVSVEVTVWQVRADGLRRHLVPRLTRVGEQELAAVSTMISTAPVRGGEDERTLIHISTKGCSNTSSK